MREALTRAETEAEQTGARHRAWMRQAQARQAELEASSAQLAAALADAKRKAGPGAAEVRVYLEDHCTVCCVVLCVV